MQKSILQRLHDGELEPFEEINPQMPEYLALQRSISAEKQHFENILPESELKRFESFCGLFVEDNAVLCYEHFAYGVRLGIKLMVETLGDVGTPNPGTEG